MNTIPVWKASVFDHGISKTIQSSKNYDFKLYKYRRNSLIITPVKATSLVTIMHENNFLPYMWWCKPVVKDTGFDKIFCVWSLQEGEGASASTVWFFFGFPYPS